MGLLAAVLTGITLSPPASAAGTRYLDEVFSEIRVTSDIPYGQAVGHDGQMETLLLDVLQPKNDTAKIRPAVVWVHGGYFVEGSKTVSWYREAREQFARAGYVTLSINYRLDPNLPYGAGPAATAFAGTSFVTTVAVPRTLLSPTVTPRRIATP